jgi:hypothetical protein
MPASEGDLRRCVTVGTVRLVGSLCALAAIVALAPCAAAQAHGLRARADVRGASIPTRARALRLHVRAPLPVARGVRREQARVVRRLVRQLRRIARQLRSSRARPVVAPAPAPADVAPPAGRRGASPPAPPESTPARSASRPARPARAPAHERASHARHGHIHKSARDASAGHEHVRMGIHGSAAAHRGQRRGRRVGPGSLVLVRDARPAAATSRASSPDAGGAQRRGGAAPAPAVPASAQLPDVSSSPAADGSLSTTVVVLGALALIAAFFLASLGYRPRWGSRRRRG